MFARPSLAFHAMSVNVYSEARHACRWSRDHSVTCFGCLGFPISAVMYGSSYFAESGNGEGRVAADVAANTNCVNSHGVYISERGNPRSVSCLWMCNRGRGCRRVGRCFWCSGIS